jgi:hypothetical protein
MKVPARAPSTESHSPRGRPPCPRRRARRCPRRSTRRFRHGPARTSPSCARRAGPADKAVADRRAADALDHPRTPRHVDHVTGGLAVLHAALHERRSGDEREPRVVHRANEAPRRRLRVDGRRPGTRDQDEARDQRGHDRGFQRSSFRPRIAHGRRRGYRVFLRQLVRSNSRFSTFNTSRAIMSPPSRSKCTPSPARTCTSLPERSFMYWV